MLEVAERSVTEAAVSEEGAGEGREVAGRGKHGDGEDDVASELVSRRVRSFRHGGRGLGERLQIAFRSIFASDYST